MVNALPSSDRRGSANLLHQSMHQAETVAFAFGLGLDAFTIIVAGHGRRVDVAGVGLPLPLSEGMVTAVGDELRDDDASRHHHVVIEDERFAVATQLMLQIVAQPVLQLFGNSAGKSCAACRTKICAILINRTTEWRPSLQPGKLIS